MSLSLSSSLLWSLSLAVLPSNLFLTASHTLHMALMFLTSCPPFLSHINSKIALSSFHLLFCLCSMLLFPLLPAFNIFFYFKLPHPTCSLPSVLLSTCFSCGLALHICLFSPLPLSLLCVYTFLLLIPFDFPDIYQSSFSPSLSLNFSFQSATWGCCRLYLMLT